MRTKPFGSNKDAMVFSSVENQQASYAKLYKSIQPEKSLEKENQTTHSFISSAYTNLKQPVYPHSTTLQVYKHVPQTFTTNGDRALPTTTRPTMGGKTIGSIHPPSSAVKHSCQELKMLSRRINPCEPLASPHASPTKPPLPVLSSSKKRARPATSNLPNKIHKVTTDEHIFECEPCNKKYKTRNGLNYHLSKCKFRKLESQQVINCICEKEFYEGTMIECTTCHTWLHSACIEFTDESTYVCARCDDEEHTLQNGTTINLSELSHAQKNLLQSLQQAQTVVDEEEKPAKNEFNFISLFSDDASTFDQPWSFDPPSLVFDDEEEPPSSFLDEQQQDWLHFANFDDDFHVVQEDED